MEFKSPSCRGPAGARKKSTLLWQNKPHSAVIIHRPLGFFTAKTDVFGKDVSEIMSGHSFVEVPELFAE